MGSYQSKITPEAEKAMLERLRTLDINDDESEEEFVHVGSEKDGDVRLVRKAEGLSVSQLNSWQSQALRDPKNRFVSSFSFHTCATSTLTWRV